MVRFAISCMIWVVWIIPINGAGTGTGSGFDIVSVTDPDPDTVPIVDVDTKIDQIVVQNLLQPLV